MADSQSFVEEVYTIRPQLDKSISTLRGILLGINSDGIVHEKELQELSEWAICNNNLLENASFSEFMGIIAEVVSRNSITVDDIEELFWRCDEFEPKNLYYDFVTYDIQELHGYCHGILSDGKISDKEVYALNAWLKEKEHLANHYPYDEICCLINRVLEDNRIEESEQKMLKAYFLQFTDIKREDTRQALDCDTKDTDVVTLLNCNPHIEIEGKTFCITGSLEYGLKEDLSAEITDRGGLVSDVLRKNTDYLIVGCKGSRAWAFTRYGRKVEKAVSMRKAGSCIQLVSEKDFVSFLNK